MTPLLISQSAFIESSCERVYRIISDYHEGHPSILPKQFHSLVVEKGGVGEGTMITFQASAFGTNKTLRAEIYEPEPGHVLLEAYPDEDMETTFFVEPDGSRCKVTISTKMNVRGGIFGAIEGWLTKRFLESIYKTELQNLDRVARTEL
jgi:hypothetical protein